MTEPTTYPVEAPIRMKHETLDAIEVFAKEQDIDVSKATRLLLDDHLIGLGYLDQLSQ